MNLLSFIFKYAMPFLTSLFLSFILTPAIRRMAVRYKFVVYPKQDRWRKRVVASLGGIAIFIAFLVPYLIFVRYNLMLVGFVFGALGIFWLGFIDDVTNIKPDTKLIGQIIIACLVIIFGIRLNIFAAQIIDIPLTIFWIVGIINAFNLLDNMDGLCAGIASISALILGIHSIINNNIPLLTISLIILGSTLGFLKYNFNPAKIFMGDCGSMFLGYALGVGALIGTTKEKSGLLITMAIPALVLAVPIFDTIFVTLARTINKRPISQGGKDHTSHRLVALGLSEKKAVLLLYAISATCGLIVLLYPTAHFIYTLLLLVAVIIGLFVFGIFLGTEVKVYSPSEIDNSKVKKKLNGKIIFSGFIYNKRRIVEVILDFMIISGSYITAFSLRFEGPLLDINMPLILQSLPLVVIIKLSMFYLFGLYRGVWRYVGIYDVVAIFKGTTAASFLCVIFLVFLFRFESYSRTVFVIDWLVTFVSISGVRILFRVYREFFANLRITGKRVLIFGAGDAGELTLREIRHNKLLGYRVLGFIDDDEDKWERTIHGIKVLGTGDDLEKLIYKNKIDEVLIAIPKSNRKRFQEIKESCDKARIPFTEVSRMIMVQKEP